MRNILGTTFDPEQLSSLEASFEQARLRLQTLGYQFGPEAANALARLIVDLRTVGLNGERLVTEAMRMFQELGRDGGALHA